MDPWIFWLICAAALVIVELLTQWISAFCFAIGCIAALVAELCGLSLPLQLLWLGIGALVGFVIFIPYFKRRIERRNQSEAHSATGMDALLGKEAVVTRDIHPGAMGRVKIDGDSWQATSDSDIPAGRRVKVLSYDSIVLAVKPLPD